MPFPHRMLYTLSMRKKIIITIACICGGALSIALSYAWFSSANFAINKYAINYLDDKQKTVLALTAAIAVASTAIAAVPGDATTPIAQSIANITDKLIIVSGAIFFEKYLVTLLGMLIFRFLIPLLCMAYILSTWKDSFSYQKSILKWMLVGICMYAIIPTSVWISNGIEENHETTIQEAVDHKNDKNNIDEDTDKNLWDTITDTISNTASNAIEYCETVLKNFTEATAIMLVTSCLIPVCVMFLFLYICKNMFPIPLQYSSQKKLKHKNSNAQDV